MAGVTTWAWRVRPRRAEARATLSRQSHCVYAIDVNINATFFCQVVFVPFWIAYVLLFVAFVAALVKTVVVYWNRRETWQTRVYWTVATLTFLMLVVPTFVFMVRHQGHGEQPRPVHRLTWLLCPVFVHV